MLHIHLIQHDKKQFLDLLLLADEQESMIDRYLERGDMFALSEDNEIKAICVVTREGNGICELKNIAPQFQRKGYGKRLLEHIMAHYKKCCHTLFVGTGDSQTTVPFYEHCGFTYSHRIPDFFTDNYDHPIIEAGKLLKDMIYLKKEL